MNGPASITVTPVLVADLLAESTRLEAASSQAAPVPQVPAGAVAAVIGVKRSITMMTATGGADRLATADEHGLGGASALQAREVAVDEMSVDQEAHEPMVAESYDSSAVAIQSLAGAGLGSRSANFRKSSETTARKTEMG
jgi:hypothetical protein